MLGRLRTRHKLQYSTKILKGTSTYVYYETLQCPILTTNPNYRGLEAEENPSNKPKRRGPAKPRKSLQEKVTDTFEPPKKKRAAAKSKAAKNSLITHI